MDPSNRESDKPAKKSGFLDALDHVAGDIVLGTIGRVSFHATQIPAVGTALRYIGENLKDGYVGAEQASKRRQLTKDLLEITKTGGVPVESGKIREMCIKRGIPESSLKEIEASVARAMAPPVVHVKTTVIPPNENRAPAPGTFPKPAFAGG